MHEVSFRKLILLLNIVVKGSVTNKNRFIDALTKVSRKGYTLCSLLVRIGKYVNGVL